MTQGHNSVPYKKNGDLGVRKLGKGRKLTIFVEEMGYGPFIYSLDRTLNFPSFRFWPIAKNENSEISEKIK